MVLSRSRSWSGTRTALITVLCGLGHVLGSVLLGAVGLLIGAAIFRLEAVESARGDLAAWLMIAFGLVYAVWGWRRNARGERHEHRHLHADGKLHCHPHDHRTDHVHVHEHREGASVTPWILFTIFVFGPCEVLIPQLMYPAATGDPMTLVLVVAVFGLTTIATMLGMVLVLTFGLRRLRFTWLQRHTHEVAGATVAACGTMILVGL